MYGNWRMWNVIFYNIKIIKNKLLQNSFGPSKDKFLAPHRFES